MIEQLPHLAPDSTRSERTRTRCHKKIARQNQPRVPRSYRIERAVLLGLGTVYLYSLTLGVLQVLGR
jgi:hypothetical protein